MCLTTHHRNVQVHKIRDSLATDFQEVLLYLDYGKMYDSAGGHVNVFGVSIVGRTVAGELERRRFNLFFDKNIKEDDASKNWHTTILCVRELVRA